MIMLPLRAIVDVIWYSGGYINLLVHFKRYKRLTQKKTLILDLGILPRQYILSPTELRRLIVNAPSLGSKWHIWSIS